MGLSHRHPPARARREMFQLERGTGMRLAMYAGLPVQIFKNTGGGAGKQRLVFLILGTAAQCMPAGRKARLG